MAWITMRVSGAHPTDPKHPNTVWCILYLGFVCEESESRFRTDLGTWILRAQDEARPEEARTANHFLTASTCSWPMAVSINWGPFLIENLSTLRGFTLQAHSS